MINISSLTKCFGKMRALDNLNLDIERGELLGLIGPNGAGKTTAIRIISCILKPDQGEVKVGGYDVLKNPLEIKGMIGYLPEEPNLYERFTAYDLLKYFGELYGVPSDYLDDRIEELLELVDMKSRARHQINTFSKGLRQRIGIARALIHDPEIIIFDEPTMGLDPATSLVIRDFIKSLKGDKTIILCTHYMDEADALCDRVAILNNGRILDLGTPKELKSKIEGDVILKVILNDKSRLNLTNFLNRPEIKNMSWKDNSLILALQSKKDIPFILKLIGTNIKSVNTEEPTLEDVFIQNVSDIQEN